MKRRLLTIVFAGGIGTVLAVCLPRAARGETLLWQDAFDDTNSTCWTITTSGACTAALDDTAGNLANGSIRIWSTDNLQGTGAHVQSRSIPIDLTQEYTVRYAFRYVDFHWARILLFGHIRLLLDTPGWKMLYDPVGDNSFQWNFVSNTDFEVYLPANEWGWLTVHCRPADREYDVFVNGTHVGTVAYQSSVVPTPYVWFEDNYSASNYLLAWFDDFSVTGMYDARQVSYARPGLVSDPEEDCTAWYHPPFVPWHCQYSFPDVRQTLAEPCNPPAPNGRCYLACLDMVFDRFGDALPVPSQNPVNPGAQEEIAAVANTNDRDSHPDSLWHGTWASDLRRAAHFSKRTTAGTAVRWACPPSPPFGQAGAAGYTWRDLGYSVVDTIWTDLAPEDEDSVAAGRFPFVLESFLASGYPIIALFNPTSEYADSLADDGYDGEKDTTALGRQDGDPVGHAAVIIGYDNIGNQGFNPYPFPCFLLSDPKGAKYEWYPMKGFWNGQWGSKRFVFAAPWEARILSEPSWVYNCPMDATVLASYTGPKPLGGFYPISNPSAKLQLGSIGLQPGEWLSHTLTGLSRTGDFDFSTWKLKIGPSLNTWPPTVVYGWIQTTASGRLSPALSSVSYGSYADDIGGSGSEGMWLAGGGCFKLVDVGFGNWPYGGGWWGAGGGGSGFGRNGGGGMFDLTLFVRNFGQQTVPGGSTAEVTYGEPTLAGRSGTNPIDMVPLPILASGDTATIGPIPWAPPSSNGFGEPYFALFGHVYASGDPDSSVWPQDENNLAYMNDYDLAAARETPETVHVWVENPEPLPMECLLRIERSDEAEDWSVATSLPADTLLGFGPTSSAPIEIVITVPSTDPDTAGSITLYEELHDPSGGFMRVTGGVNLSLHLPVSTSVAGNDAPPRLFLEPNRPNPFNPATAILYRLPAAGSVDLAIFDVTGRRVRTLVSGIKREGTHRTVWRGETDAGRPAGSGVYFVRIVQNGSESTRKITLVR